MQSMFLNQSVSMIKILSIQFFLPCPYLIDLFVLVELWPKDFNQDMCSWASKLSSSIKATNMFVGTGCPEIEVGTSGFSGWPSPLCYECSAPTASPTASFYPSSSPTNSELNAILTVGFTTPTGTIPDMDTITAIFKSCVEASGSLESDENLDVECMSAEFGCQCGATLEGEQEELFVFVESMVGNLSDDTFLTCIQETGACLLFGFEYLESSGFYQNPRLQGCQILVDSPPACETFYPLI